MKTIWFIRHAESNANVGLITTQNEIITLTHRGEQQARELVNAISIRPDLIITSGYLRTRQTAQPTIEKYFDVPVEVWPLHEFEYLDPVLCAHTTPDTRRPWVSDYWERCDPDFIHGSGAESYRMFFTRITKSLADIEELTASKILVFTHGHVIKTIKQFLTSDKNSNATRYMKEYASKIISEDVTNTAILKTAYYTNGVWQILN